MEWVLGTFLLYYLSRLVAAASPNNQGGSIALVQLAEEFDQIEILD